MQASEVEESGNIQGIALVKLQCLALDDGDGDIRLGTPVGLCLTILILTWVQCWATIEF